MDHVFDEYAALSYKAPMRSLDRFPGWVPVEDRRRLAAYLVRAAYLGNSARELLSDEAVRDSHREYGDPRVVVDRIVAAVLGTDWRIRVEGAGVDPLRDGPSFPVKPVRQIDDDAQDSFAAVFEAQLEGWRAQVEEAVSAWVDSLTLSSRADDVSRQLVAWADRRNFGTVVAAHERNSVGLGDSAVAFWPQADDWPLVTVLQPDGMFFGEGVYGQFPTTLHYVWETERDDGRWLHRQTWRTVDLTESRVGTDSDGNTVWFDVDGLPSLNPHLASNERVVDGRIRRFLPWNDPDDVSTWATETVMFSDASWKLDRVRSVSGFYDISDDVADWEVRPTDIGVDFIPVVHQPNDPLPGAVWGSSVFDHTTQILDDIAVNDTDAMQASRYLSDPTLFISGVTANIGEVSGPGRIYKTGSDSGDMKVLDLSAGTRTLLEQGDRLQDRFRQNVGIPSEMLGHADANVSGITLALRLAPFAQLIGTMRQDREPKYRLMLSFVQRLAQVAGVLDAGPTVEAGISFGNFLPTNKGETVDMVTKALNAHAISTSTAVAMLIAAGLPISDARDEIRRIRSENTTAARELADAVQSEQAAADWLGIDLPVRTFLPEIELGD